MSAAPSYTAPWDDGDDDRELEMHRALVGAAILVRLSLRRYRRAKAALDEIEAEIVELLDRAEAVREAFHRACDQVEENAKLYARARDLT